MAYGQRTSPMENHAGKDIKKMVSITVHLPWYENGKKE